MWSIARGSKIEKESTSIPSESRDPVEHALRCLTWNQRHEVVRRVTRSNSLTKILAQNSGHFCVMNNYELI